LAKASKSAEARAKIFDARNQSPIFDDDGFVDVGAFCLLLQENFPASPIETCAEAVRQALSKYVLGHSVAPKGTTKKISQSTGVSLWFPPWIQYPNVEILEKTQSEAYFYNHYSETRFARLTGWYDCLKKILQNKLYDDQFEEAVMASSDDEAFDPGEGNTREMGHSHPVGKNPPAVGKNPPVGKNPVAEDVGGGRVFLGGSSREAGVVVRATVESYGPVGETELQVNVKWPAGCNSSPIVEPVRKMPKLPGGTANVE